MTLLMEQSWHPESVIVSRKRMELAAVKEYLDEHYTEKLTLDELAEKFFINKFYLSKIFKETYPMRRKTPCFSYGDIRRVHRIYASN